MPVTLLPITSLSPHPANPRRSFNQEALEELARSLAANGQLDPIVVRPTSDGRYQVISGHRRLAAAKLLNWDTLRADVKDLDDETADYLLLEANIQHCDLSPVEEAEGIQRMIAVHHWSQTKVAERFAKSQAWISYRLSLLGLAPEVKEKVITQVISATQAREIAKAPVEIQTAVADKAVKANLPKDEIQRMVGVLNDPEAPADVKSALLKEDRVTPAHAEAIAHVQSDGFRKALLSDVSKGNLTVEATQRVVEHHTREEHEPTSVSRERARRHVEIGSTLLKAKELLEQIEGRDIAGLDSQALVTAEARLMELKNRLDQLSMWITAAQQGNRQQRQQGAGKLYTFPGAR